MTEPVVYQTKPAHQVEAMQFDGSEESSIAISNWYGSLSETTVGPLIFPAGNMALMEGENPILEVGLGNFVYLDEDGFHSASKNSFEMYYKEAPAV